MKTPIAFLSGGLTGAILGAGAMLIAFPFLFPPPVLDEPPPAAVVRLAPPPGGMRLATAAQATLDPITSPPAAGPSVGQPASGRIAAGTFDRASPGRDALHWADGTVGLYRQGDQLVLRLEGDFAAGPGPDFYLYLSTAPVGEERAFLADAGRVKLTRLRAFRGGQNYMLPPGIDLAAIRSVTIWCERFSEFIGNATLDGLPA